MPPDISTPAATLIVMRESAGPPELLMVERAATLRFAGGALVFPGGRVDPGDLLLAEGDSLAAAKLAAIRETLEETGIAVAMTPAPGPAETTAMRAALLAGDALAATLAGRGIELQLDALVPFARWNPRHLAHHAFDTHFFITRAPAGPLLPSIDNGEVIRAFLATAADLLAAADRGEARLIFPTRRVLERLARFDGFAAAVADAAANPIVPITPWIEPRGGVLHLCIPEGLGYPVTAEPLEQVQRG